MKRLLLLLLVLSVSTGSSLRAQDASARGTASVAGDGSIESDLAQAQAGEPAADEGFVASRESVPAQTAPAATAKVVYNPKVRRDPTLSPDDILILKDRADRLRAAQLREQKLAEEAERRRLAAEERRRQRQLLLLKYPELEVKNRFRIGGVIGKEVFFGNNADRMYTVGSTFPVKGESGEMRRVKIEDVRLDSVVFSYQGRRFTKKI